MEYTKQINLKQNSSILFNLCKSKILKDNPRIKKSDDNSICEIIFKKFSEGVINGK